MTHTEAITFADGLQERVTQMGDRTGEGQYLGQALSVIRTLAGQLEALQTTTDASVVAHTPEPEIVAPADAEPPAEPHTRTRRHRP